MKTIHESGHAIQAARLEKMVAACISYGTQYQPANALLTVKSLKGLQKAAEGWLDEDRRVKALLNRATNDREVLYGDLKGLSTRIVNALGTGDVLEQTLADARAVNRKIQGQRAARLPKKEAPAEGAAEGPRTISASQTSFDNQAGHFGRLIKLVQEEAGYAPNESELSVAGLQKRYDLMLAANKAVVNWRVTASDTETKRDGVLYSDPDSVYERSRKVKRYVKSVFGSTSAEYKLVSGLIFKNRARY